MVFAIGSVAFQMAAGALGQIMSYRFAILLLATIELTAMFLLICLPAKENRPVYEASETQSSVDKSVGSFKPAV